MPTIDTNSAYITSLSKLRTGFKAADTNTDGSISAAEFEAVAKASAGLSGKDGLATTAIFKRLDTNSDHLITQAELTQGINLASQVQSVLLQGQELTSGSAYAGLLAGVTQPSSLFGNSNDYTSLTSNLLGGGSASSSLTSILTGANANTASLGLFGGLSNANSALIQQLLARYNITADVTTPKATATA